MSGALSLNNYYIKCRIGPNSSSLNEGQTYNSQTPEWLNDTDAWTHMPQITIGSDGNWQGPISCRIKISAVDESKMIYVRACLNLNSSCGTSFQSNTFLTINTILPTSTPTPVPTSTPAPTITPNPTNTPTPTLKITLKPTTKPSPSIQTQSIATKTAILGESSESAVIQTPTVTPQEIKIASEKSNNLLPKILILIGIVFLIACAIVVFYPYLRNLRNKNIDE